LWNIAGLSEEFGKASRFSEKSAEVGDFAYHFEEMGMARITIRKWQGWC